MIREHLRKNYLLHSGTGTCMYAVLPLICTPGLVNSKCAGTIGNGVLRVTPSIELDTLQEYRAYRRIHNLAYSADVHQLFEHDIFACADVPVHLRFDWQGGVVTQGDIEQGKQGEHLWATRFLSSQL